MKAMLGMMDLRTAAGRSASAIPIGIGTKVASCCSATPPIPPSQSLAQAPAWRSRTPVLAELLQGAAGRTSDEAFRKNSRPHATYVPPGDPGVRYLWSSKARARHWKTVRLVSAREHLPVDRPGDASA